jgi:hypothetical protein
MAELRGCGPLARSRRLKRRNSAIDSPRQPCREMAKALLAQQKLSRSGDSDLTSGATEAASGVARSVEAGGECGREGAGNAPRRDNSLVKSRHDRGRAETF